MTILVTGAAGYIGSIASKVLLGRGFKVVGLDNLSTSTDENIPEGVNFYKGDIADTDLVSKIIQEESVDSVMHFAGYIQVGESVLKPEMYIENNLHKSKKFLDTVKKSGVNKFIFSSSAAVYGNPQHERLLSENDELKPINPYGQTKLDFEKELEKASEDGLKFIALRYFNVVASYGDLGECHEPETHLVPLVLDAALGKRDSIKIFGTDYPTDDGTAIRDYVHVLDLVEGHIDALKALDTDKSNRAYNLAYGNGFSVKEVIDTAKKVTGIDFKVEEVERREGDPARLVADPSEAKEILGWKPKYDDLEKIVSDAYAHRKLFHSKKALVK